LHGNDLGGKEAMGLGMNGDGILFARCIAQAVDLGQLVIEPYANSGRSASIAPLNPLYGRQALLRCERTDQLKLCPDLSYFQERAEMARNRKIAFSPSSESTDPLVGL
jgi:hypothetical protein